VPEAFHRAAWLIRSRALTVLPSISSLKALRQFAKDSHASHALTGFGNPLLRDPDQRYTALAEAAREKQSCSKTLWQQIADGEQRGVLQLNLRGGLAQIQRASPLPDTADELCAVARDLKGDTDAIHLGANATETEVKRLSAFGELSKYQVIHFEAHGALAG
jgi:CHAT domain-containing protein